MLPLPANLDLGASYEFGKDNQWMIGVNLCYVFWNTYDSLIFNFQEKTLALDISASPTLYVNQLIVRLGSQYKLNKIFTFRAGGYYDPSPVSSNYLTPQTPSLTQWALTGGLSVNPFKGFSIDASFAFLMGIERHATYSPENFSGTYKSGFSIPGIGLSYSF
jgi:long-chain fatty acid transport protein